MEFSIIDRAGLDCKKGLAQAQANDHPFPTLACSTTIMFEWFKKLFSRSSRIKALEAEVASLKNKKGKVQHDELIIGEAQWLIQRCFYCKANYPQLSYLSWMKCPSCLRDDLGKAEATKNSYQCRNGECENHNIRAYLPCKVCQLQEENRAAYKVIKLIDSQAHINSLSKKVWRAISDYYNQFNKQPCRDNKENNNETTN